MPQRTNEAALDKLVGALMRASAKEHLSELLRVSQRLSLALVVGHSL